MAGASPTNLTLTGKVGLISDAHGNVGAARKAVDVVRKAGADRVIFLGDAVGYIPSRAVLDFLDAEGIFALKGNHEAMLVGELTAENERAAQVYRHEDVRALLTDQELARIATRSPEAAFDCAAGRVLLCHGSPDDPLTGYIYPDTPLEDIAREDFDMVFMGHTHRPFRRRAGDRLFVNVGSCGQPRDHGCLGAACIFDADSGEVTLVRFDIVSETREAIHSAKLEGTYVAEVLERESTEPVVGSMVQ